jgi:hypothetical protein
MPQDVSQVWSRSRESRQLADELAWSVFCGYTHMSYDFSRTCGKLESSGIVKCYFLWHDSLFKVTQDSENKYSKRSKVSMTWPQKPRSSLLPQSLGQVRHQGLLDSKEGELDSISQFEE